MKIKTIFLIVLSFFCINIFVHAKTYTLKYGMVAGTSSIEYEAAQILASYVKENSNGDLIIKIYPNSQLGDDRAVLEQMSASAVDMGLAEPGRLGIWIKRATAFTLPYIFDDYNHAKRSVYNTDFGKGVLKEALDKHKWRVLGMAYNGIRHTSSNRKIESISDMKGLKLRVPNAQHLLDYAKLSGASPTPMAFTEVYLALKTNVADAQENPLSTIKAMKFYEVQKYIALTGHVINPVLYIISDKSYKKLPKNLQTVLNNGIAKATDYHTNKFQDQDRSLISFFESNGVTITRPPLEPFKKAMKSAYDEFIKENGEKGKEGFAAIQSQRI